MKQVAIVFAAFLTACVSSGTQVTDQQASQFVKGVSTEADVIAKLGTPNGSSHLSNGMAVIVYSFVEAKPNAVDFVPVVGLLAGGAKGHATTVTFMFDASGKLSSYSTSSTTSEVHTGLVN